MMMKKLLDFLNLKFYILTKTKNYLEFIFKFKITDIPACNCIHEV